MEAPENTDRIKVIALTELDQMVQIEQLQEEIWGYGRSGADPPYPARALFALVQSGGLVSLALCGKSKAGFSVAWLGRIRRTRTLYLHSQLVGVRTAFRGRHIGLALKLHQKDFAQTEGLGLIRWTFDPLRATNARFNLNRLRAVCRKFQPAFYGELRSQFQTGEDSDRLWAEWHLDSPRVKSRSPGRDEAVKARFNVPMITRCEPLRIGEHVIPKLNGWKLNQKDSRLQVEIPLDLDLVRRSDQIVSQWRASTREIFEHYLNRGYTLTDFDLDGARWTGRYLLDCRPLEEILQD